jgi:D-hexose-6-phosphate mutarotase
VIKRTKTVGGGEKEENERTLFLSKEISELFQSKAIRGGMP